MRNDKRKNRVFLAGLLVIMMIINLLSGINASVLKAEEPGGADENIKTLIIEKKWVDGLDYHDNVTVTITSDTGEAIDPITLENDNWNESIQLKAKTPEGTLINYTVSETPVDTTYEPFETRAILSPDNKTEKGDVISFNFGDSPVDKKVTFESSSMKKEKVKIRKVWRCEPANKAIFQLVAIEDQDGIVEPDDPSIIKQAVATIELDESDATTSSVEGETVWEREYIIYQPGFKISEDDKKISLVYEIEEVGDDGKAVLFPNVETVENSQRTNKI